MSRNIGLGLLLIVAGTAGMLYAAAPETSAPTPAAANVASSSPPRITDARAALHPSEVPADGPCVCDAECVSIWCGPCRRGHIAGVVVESSRLFEALDPHGHEFRPAAIPCERCHEAIAEDGFCESCRRGFHDDRLYFSRLTWSLAGAVPAADCAHSSGSESDQWCARCDAGSIDSLVIADRDRFDDARRETRRLRDALAHLDRCESCAIASFLGSRCPRCALAWEHDEPPASPTHLHTSKGTTP